MQNMAYWLLKAYLLCRVLPPFVMQKVTFRKLVGLTLNNMKCYCFYAVVVVSISVFIIIFANNL